MTMLKSRLLSDEIYNDELDRMRMMKRFAEVPAARQEMIRALRRVSQNDKLFLHDLITFFIDNAERCPTPHELIERAGIMRASKSKPLGSPACEKCYGTGYIHTTRIVKISGMEPYEAECSMRCDCAPTS